MNPKDRLRSPLTGNDREKLWESYMLSFGFVTRRVQKARFGKNDILGADIISYKPSLVVFSQTTDIDNMSHRKRKIEGIMLIPPAEDTPIIVEVIGINGFKEKKQIQIERIAKDDWLCDGSWHREEIDPMAMKRHGTARYVLKDNGGKNGNV